MLERARERARAAGLGHVSFEQADAQLEPLHDFDRVFSRFGVMFFADPVDAFANLRRALGPGGRIAFICWRPVAENPWIHEPMRILAELVELPAPAPGAPGPFSLGARERLEHVLERARFADLDVERLDLPLLVGGGGVEQALHFLLQVGPASRVLREHPEIVEQASVSLRALLEKHAGPGGVRMDSASWVVTARA